MLRPHALGAGHALADRPAGLRESVPKDITGAGADRGGLLVEVLARSVRRAPRRNDPLLHSAFQLQSRLYNVCAQSFLEVYLCSKRETERRYAEERTLWLVGQFLGWVEILRREVQFLDLNTVERNRRLEEFLGDIRPTMLSDGLRGRAFRAFAAEQRAIGEVMIVPRGDGDRVRNDCMGYAEFTSCLEKPDFARWFGPLRQELTEMVHHPRPERAVLLQRSLIDLIFFLEDSQSRFPARMLSRLPLGATQG